MKEAIPNWWKTKLKSQKWGDSGNKVAISADVTVGVDGGTSVTYYTAEHRPNSTTGKVDDNKFGKYMQGIE